jgi:hypothetical protein
VIVEPRFQFRGGPTMPKAMTSKIVGAGIRARDDVRTVAVSYARARSYRERRPSMGYCPFYQALPEASDLCRILESDLKARTLLMWLFNYGSRPFDMRELEENELTSILDDAAEEDEVFDSRGDVDITFVKLRDEIERADSAHPGLIDRTAFLNKSQDEIGERLTARLEEAGISDAKRLVRSLLFGEYPFAARTDPLQIVSPETVKRGMLTLREIEPDMLFGGPDEDYIAEDYRQWRELYVQAGERGEAVLMY